MFDFDLIVLNKVVVYIRREIGAIRWLAEEGKWEEVMRVYSRVRSGLIRQKRSLNRFGGIRHRSSVRQQNDRATAEKK